MGAQAGDVPEAKKMKYSDTSFRIISFQRQSFQQISPFHHSGDQHFAILFYTYDEKGNNNKTENNGHLIFKSPGQIDAMIQQRNIVNGFCIQFTEIFLLNNRQLLSIITGFPFFEISLLKNRPLVLSDRESEAVEDLYKKVYEEYNHQNSNSIEMATVYLQALFLTIKRVYESYSDTIEENTTSKRQPGEIVRKFKSLVLLDTVIATDKSVARKTVNAYASLLFIHPNYLNALVKKETGKTAREYIDEQLFNCAKRLLLNEELLVKEIAWQLSFNETAHFTNFFKRHAGISPGVFRKQYFAAAA
ncbi:helix-turn-helix domain-containing protein [Lacibacter sp. H407]|uniref:helix-turn-helix domain-containing protein n=1 Tax=Lacibacter sp. H407 TaxID=3133423 RepID=UPI0030C2D9B0